MKNEGKDWTQTDINNLKSLIKEGKTTEQIASSLGRTIEAIYNKASELKISLVN